MERNSNLIRLNYESIVTHLILKQFQAVFACSVFSDAEQTVPMYTTAVTRNDNSAETAIHQEFKCCPPLSPVYKKSLSLDHVPFFAFHS